ncbi:hypothetical protein [uncultured Clostridium sp.]|uniref:hypothetical protein n=1 Tax=uncultured Clostridium sp. TaxID=59620 RepID=UPI0025DF2989|nr:hypothetical protein [uncultured Clostridium sp.]
MKKIKLTALIIASVLCVGVLIGCGGSSSETTPSTTSSDSTNSTSSTDTQSTDNQIYTQDFTLINNTGVEIYELYVSPHSENDWGEDVLTVDTLPTEQNVEIKFTPQEQSQYWDIMIKDQEGTSITWENIDLFTVSQVTLNFDGTTPTASFQ